MSPLLTTALLVGPADQPDGTILLEPFEFHPFFLMLKENYVIKT